MASNNSPWRFDSLSIAPSLGFKDVWVIPKKGEDPINLRYYSGDWYHKGAIWSAGDDCRVWCWAPYVQRQKAPSPPTTTTDDIVNFVALPDPNTMPGEVIKVEFDGCPPMQLRSIDRVGGWVGLNGWVPTKAELDKVKWWVRVQPKKRQLIPYPLERGIREWIESGKSIDEKAQRANALVYYIKNGCVS